MIISIIMSDRTKKYDLSSVKFATCGAAPLEKGPQARFQELLADDAVLTQVRNTMIAVPFVLISKWNSGRLPLIFHVCF